MSCILLKDQKASARQSIPTKIPAMIKDPSNTSRRYWNNKDSGTTEPLTKFGAVVVTVALILVILNLCQSMGSYNLDVTLRF